jgi:hypothetical protein
MELAYSRFGGSSASVSTSQPRFSPRINRRSCPATRGLGIARPPAFNERPRAIGGPLEHSFRSGDGKFRRLGSATVVVSIRRWIGSGYSVHYRWYSRGRGAAVPWAAPKNRNRKDPGGGPHQFLYVSDNSFNLQSSPISCLSKIAQL